MVARLGIALLLALLLVGLGVTIRFGGPGEEVDVSLFFELRWAPSGDGSDAREPLGHRFAVGDGLHTPPLLLPLDDADPGLIDGSYPGAIIPIELSPVSQEAFVRPELLLAELKPGIEVVRTSSETVSYLPAGRMILFRVASIVVGREPGGEERAWLLLGFGGDDPEERLPERLRDPRAIAISIEAPAGAPPLVSRLKPETFTYEGPVERPVRIADRIVVFLGPEAR